MFYKLVGLRGPLALFLKLGILGGADSALVWFIAAALNRNSFIIAGVVVASLIFLNYSFITKGAIPLKFLAVGLIFFSIFVVTPTGYTIIMSTYNFKTGNEIAKTAAIREIINNGIAPDAEGTAYDLFLGKTKSGKYGAILQNQVTKELFYGDENAVRPATESEVTRDTSGVIIGAIGLTNITPEQFANDDATITALRFPIGDGSYVAPQESTLAARLIQTVTYDPVKDEILNKDSGITYVDNGNGNFAAKDDPSIRLDPGWRAFSGLDNFKSLLLDKKLRDPFIKVFIWTVAFAFLSVATTFAVGMALAIALEAPIKFRRFYRGFLILPYAIPSFMSILIWKGLFNKDYGAINLLLGTHIAWFDSPWLAKFAVILVNLWLGFPYMYLIGSGALQSIPSELEEAASIDGASEKQTFYSIKLPLLLQILGPLLISSFAFNFNNFNIIYLLTGGGPTRAIDGEIAGGTDILISYAYKTAFGSNFKDLGLSSAISMVMFVIVGAMSMYTLKKSKIMETL
jgi:arabinogalactan oligomer / maltooligosaccharide transport system permease protein